MYGPNHLPPQPGLADYGEDEQRATGFVEPVPAVSFIPEEYRQTSDDRTNLGFRRDLVPAPRGAPVPIPPPLEWIVQLARDRTGLARVLDAYSGLVSQFWYGLTALILANNGTLSNQTIPLATDSYFVATALIFRTNALTPTNPVNSTVSWSDTTGQTLFSNRAVPIDMIATVIQPPAAATSGYAQPKKYLPRERVFAPGTTMSFDFADRGTGVSQTFDIVVEGYKIYFKGMAPGAR